MKIYQNPQYTIQERTEDLLNRMTLEEKAAQLMCVIYTFSFEEGKFDKIDRDVFCMEDVKIGIGQIALGSFEKGAKENAAYCNRVQRLFLENSRLGIPVIFHEEGLHGHDALEGTSYPSPIALSCAFSPELVEEIDRAIAKEIRARGGQMVLTPVVDVARDLRWGRTEETFGEDPYLVSQLGGAAVRGFQGKGEEYLDSCHLPAVLKHFAAHSCSENGMNIAPACCDADSLQNVLLRPFREIVAEEKPWGVMASYNELNGIPLHANRKMLTDILRKQWGFEGFVVSDWFGIEQLMELHHSAESIGECCRQAFEAGVDCELPARNAYRSLVKLVKEGVLSESAIDDSVRRILRCKFAMGMFEKPYVDELKVESVVGCEEHRRLARKAAVQSAVLLKNQQVLPIAPRKYKKLVYAALCWKPAPAGITLKIPKIG